MSMARIARPTSIEQETSAGKLILIYSQPRILLLLRSALMAAQQFDFLVSDLMTSVPTSFGEQSSLGHYDQAVREPRALLMETGEHAFSRQSIRPTIADRGH